MNETLGASAISTKDRILDAAERLLSEHGFEATSLRAITAEADVNLAAVNYHFQSKDALFRAVIARRLGPVNEKRLAMLDAIESAAGDRQLPLGLVIEAFIRPVLEVRNCAREFAPIMGRVFSEKSEITERVFRDHLAHVAQRFTVAFGRAVPALPREEVMWRSFFVIGAVAHTMVLSGVLKMYSGGLCRTDDVDGIVRRMVSVFSAAFLAPHREVGDAQMDSDSDSAVVAGDRSTA